MRATVLLLAWYLGWNWSERLLDPWVTQAYIMGLLLAHVHGLTFRLSPVLLLPALTIMCFPRDNADSVAWSGVVQASYLRHMPKALDIKRGVSYVGCVPFALAVDLSPSLQAFFGSELLQRLVRMSLGLYIIERPGTRSPLACGLPASS